MDFGELLTGSRWKILQELAKKPLSESELAAKLSTSLANISQQIRLLEAYSFVIKEKEAVQEGIRAGNKRGKPKSLYSLSIAVASVAMVTGSGAERVSREINPFEAMLLNILLFLKEQDRYFLLKHLISNDELVKHSQGIGFLKSSTEDVEIITITDDFESIRKKYSNVFIKFGDREKKIVSWTHSLQEIKDGLARKESYFINLTKKIIPIYESEEVFKKIEVLKA
ncbi:MAG: helix-turn-helix domain-containing protein [Candidatus Woesearchaeota archaeon]